MDGGRARAAFGLVPLVIASAVIAQARAQNHPGTGNGAETVQWAADLVGVAAIHEHRVVPVSPPVDIDLVLPPQSPARVERITAIVERAVLHFSETYGPYPHRTITVVDVAPSGDPEVARPAGSILVRSRWLMPTQDLSFERSVIVSIARQFWADIDVEETAPLAAGANGDATWFRESLVHYSSVRAGNALLGGDHALTEHYFGDFVPYRIRSVILARAPGDPRPPARLDGQHTIGTRGSAAGIAALTLFSLERRIGWPALQQALMALAARSRQRTVRSADFISLLGEQLGIDLESFFTAAYRFSARFDHGVASLSSEAVPASGDEAARYLTTLHVRRLGDAVFAAPRDSRERPLGRLLVQVMFDDGSAAEEWWSPTQAELEVTYRSRSRALRAAVDPELTLLLDANRGNNAVSLRPELPSFALRAVLNWMVWLQDLSLTALAFA